MSESVHHRIQNLIEETNEAFGYCGSVNADYAEFATLALSDFKSILKSPELTGRDLRRIIRKGMNQHKDKTSGSWSAFMAQHVAQSANRNTQATQ